MNKTLTKQEINFIFNILMPLNLELIEEGEYKSKLQLFINAHNPEKVISLETKREEENLTKQQHSEKAFEDTINYFLLEKINNKQTRYFSKASIYTFKEDFIYLLQYNSFYHIEGYIISVQLYKFLEHLSNTFKTLEEHSRDERLSRGTAFMTSSYRNGLEKDLNFVNKQLNNNAFSAVTNFDYERLKVSKFSIKTFRNHTSIANLFITLNAMHSFNILKTDCTEGERAGFKQVFSHLNGLKTSKEEIVRSFMIKAYFPYYKRETINKSRLAKIVHKMAENFFPNVVYLRSSGSYTIGLSPKVFKYNLYIKTALNENTIYAYDHKKEYTWLIKGTIKEALNLIRKMYSDDGNDDIVNNPLFDSTIKKLIKSPIYPL